MKVTIRKEPNLDKAVEIIQAMNDEEILDKWSVSKVLHFAGFKSLSTIIQTMSDNEYEDFIVNQCGDD